jgi:hypothetical protein
MLSLRSGNEHVDYTVYDIECHMRNMCHYTLSFEGYAKVALMANNFTISVTSRHLVIKCTLSLRFGNEHIDYTVYDIECHMRNLCHYTLFRGVRDTHSLPYAV